MNSFIKSIVKISQSFSDKLNDLFSTNKSIIKIAKPISTLHIGELKPELLKSLQGTSTSIEVVSSAPKCTSKFKTYKSTIPQKFTFSNVTFSMSSRYIISSVDDEPFKFIKINRNEKKTKSFKLNQL